MVGDSFADFYAAEKIGMSWIHLFHGEEIECERHKNLVLGNCLSVGLLIEKITEGAEL